MLHVRKTLTAKEQKEYEEWKARHQNGAKNNIRKLTKTGPITQEKNFWAESMKTARLNMELHRGGHEKVNSVDTGATGAVALKQRKMVPEHLHLDRDQIEALRQREAAAADEAKLKMNRLAPAYNKGPLILMSEEDMKTSVKSGANRRRG
jgi:hypothetical protein